MTPYQFWITGWKRLAMTTTGYRQVNALVRLGSAHYRQLDAEKAGKDVPAPSEKRVDNATEGN